VNNLIGGNSSGWSSDSSLDPDRASTNAGAFRNVPGKNAPPGMANHQPNTRPATQPTTITTRKNLKKAF
jgi:hypothetical protein